MQGELFKLTSPGGTSYVAFGLDGMIAWTPYEQKEIAWLELAGWKVEKCAVMTEAELQRELEASYKRGREQGFRHAAISGLFPEG